MGIRIRNPRTLPRVVQAQQGGRQGLVEGRPGGVGLDEGRRRGFPIRASRVSRAS